MENPGNTAVKKREEPEDENPHLLYTGFDETLR